MATKIFKIKDYSLFWPKRMQRTALVGKTNEMYNLLLGELAQVHPITRAVSGIPPSTRQVAGLE